MVIWSQMTIENGMVNGTNGDGGEPLGFRAVLPPGRRSEGTLDTSPAFQCRVGVTSAEGTAENPANRTEFGIVPQPSRSELGILLTRAPGVKTPGYCQVVPAGRRRSPRRCRAFHLCSDSQQPVPARNVSLTRALGVKFTQKLTGCFTLFQLVSPCFTYGEKFCEGSERGRPSGPSLPSRASIEHRILEALQLVSPGYTLTGIFRDIPGYLKKI